MGVFYLCSYLLYMKKVVRLTESELVKLVKKVIMEDELSSPKLDCRKFKYDPKKKVYDNEDEYNCALKYWEDAVNLYKAYIFQKNNVNWKQRIRDYVAYLNRNGDPRTYESLYAARLRNLGKPGSFIKKGFSTNYKELSMDPNPLNYDPIDPKYGDKKILDYYKQFKFNFPVAIGLYSSPDLVHKYLKPKGTYFDGIAESPIYEDPGEKPTLSTNKTVIPPTPIQSPGDVRKTNVVPTPEKVVTKPNPVTNFSVSWREDLPSGEVEQNTHYFPSYDEWNNFVSSNSWHTNKSENAAKTQADALYSGKLNLSKDKTYKNR